MRLKIDIDDALLNQALSCSKAKTVRELIHVALEEFIRLKKRKDMSELASQIKFSKDYDYKAMRTLRG
ncbi:MAG: type II toxin-antitoxin system VapB family antitoxin [Desulfobacterales bacterium]